MKEKIGYGSEKKVYKHPLKPDRVVGEFHKGLEETPQEVKARYYLTKILNIIFPENIPNIHLASTKPHKVEVDYVPHTADHKILQDEKIKFDKEEPISKELQESYDDIKTKINTDPKYLNLIKKLQDLGVELDDYEANFIKGEDGNYKYVDTLIASFADSEGMYINFYKKRLKRAIDSIENSVLKKRAKTYFKRLNQQIKEQKQNTTR